MFFNCMNIFDKIEPYFGNLKIMPKFTTKIFSKNSIILFFILIVISLLYFYSNPHPNYFYDYTYRIAEAILNGRIGLIDKPPSWLNEMVEINGKYYSVFPLGSVLTMIPFAVLKFFGVISQIPVMFIISIIGSFTFIFSFFLTKARDLDFSKRILLAAFPVLCTWAWVNLSFGGAWQIALGFAMLGQFGALYFILVKQNYFLAGIFFALAFGNRTEIIILLPAFLYLIYLSEQEQRKEFSIKIYARFSIIPIVLLSLTFAYNYIRFGSVLEFGFSEYLKLPGVSNELGYKYGGFSLYAIPLNFYYMIIRPGWDYIEKFPFIIPNGFGGSILLSSPFLFLIFKSNLLGNKIVKIAWVAIFVLSFALWVHGNPGGWQFSYRYAMIIIPWFFIILLFNTSKKITQMEFILFAVSFIINVYAIYLFNWTRVIG